MRRRLILLGGAFVLPPVCARSARSGGARLRVGADVALVESGLAPALIRAFGRETGIGVDLIAAAASPLLEALALGELDVAFGNAPASEVNLEAQGLVHDRRAIARGDFVLVGPGWPGDRPATGSAPVGVPDLLGRVRDAAAREPQGLVFLSAADGSGTHLAEQAAWRLARIGPEAPWYRQAEQALGLIAEARARKAFALVERGAWLARGGTPLSLLAEDRQALGEGVHVMRSFRSPHPAARLFVAWAGGTRGRRVAGAVPGYRPALASRV